MGKTTSLNCQNCPNNCKIICVEQEGQLLDSWENRCDSGKKTVDKVYN